MAFSSTGCCCSIVRYAGSLFSDNRPPAQFGYIVYRRVINYYSGEEDAFDMRKAMPRDVERKSVVPLTRAIQPHELGEDFS
jgi:hypothetical protein